MGYEIKLSVNTLLNTREEIRNHLEEYVKEGWIITGVEHLSMLSSLVTLNKPYQLHDWGSKNLGKTVW